MRKTAVFLAMVALLLGAPFGGSQTEADPSASASGACVSGGVTPPCGWINPQLYLDLEGVAPCNAEDGEGCMAPPTEGEPLVLEGLFILTWDVSEESTYPADPEDPVEVSFSPTGSNPSYLDFSIEPATFTLDAATLADPAHYVTKESEDGTRIWYEYIEPVTVTITRTGGPDPEDLDSIIRKDGQEPFLIRIHSDSSGSTFKDSYGLEVIYFHVGAADASDPELHALGSEIADRPVEGQSTPAMAAPLVFVAVAAMAVALRRRA